MVSFCYHTTTPFTKPTTISDMNITLKICNVNFKKGLPQEVRVFSEEDLQEFIRQGLVVKKYKQYVLTLHYRQFIIECPVLRTDDGAYRVIWPSFLLPNRPYPAFIYIFAAATYLSIGKSQRITAEKVRSFFGMTTFCHSTICRFLPRFFPILPYLVKYGAQISHDWGANPCEIVPRKHWDAFRNESAAELIRLIEPVLGRPIEFGNWLAYRYWADTGKFII